MVYMLLAEGFEEVEVVAPLDLLRRAGIDVSTAALTNDLLIQGGHGITVKADITLGQIDFEAMEMLILPGGGGGVDSIANSKAAMDLILRAYLADKTIAANCAAPSLLAKLDILDGRRVICHPTVADEVSAGGGKIQHELPVVCDNNLITGKSAGYAIEFGLEMVTFLRNSETAEKLRRAICP